MSLTKSNESPYKHVVGPELPDLSDLTAQLERSLFREQALAAPCTFAHDEGDLWGDRDEEADVSPTVANEASDETCPWRNPWWRHDGPVAQLIDWRAAELAVTSQEASAGDARRVRALAASLRQGGDTRKLATVPLDWRDVLDKMEAMFPNFYEVVHYLRAMYAVAVHGNRVAQLAPILLVGPPGVGKTHFAMYLADAFGSGFEKIHMETAQTSSALTGSAEHWANTKPGAVFNALLDGDFANPVFFLDEIDKAIEGEHDPLASLYGLLEKGTAKRFRDASYPWLPDIDASHIVWVCTCNDANGVPLPIMDRMRRFDIALPTAKQARQIMATIFTTVRNELPTSLAEIKLTKGAHELLITLSPRQAQKVLREAIGHAVYCGRMRVLASDIYMLTDEPCETARIGFLP